MFNLEKELYQFYKPYTQTGIVEWCESNVYLPQGTSAQDGFISFALYPWAEQILEDFTNPEIKHIYIKKSAQIAGTTLMACMVAYKIAHDNSSILWVMPTMDSAQSLAETRLTPILDNIPEITAKYNSKHDNKKTTKLFVDGTLRLTGTSPNALASSPVQTLFLDEVSKIKEQYKKHAEADPVRLAFERT